MVNNRKQHTRRKPAKQGVRDVKPEPNKINASTPYDFRGKYLTPYGGLLPVATVLEKLGFQFLLAIVLGLYVGFSRLNQLRFIAPDPLPTGIPKVSGLPPQSTLWRFLAGLHLNVALPACMRQSFARADSGFYGWEAVAAYLEGRCQFVIVARQTARLLDRLHGAEALAEDGGRRAMRIHLAARRVGEGLPFCSPAVVSWL
jgi:hypothetical protein